jgi:hypothetical protein
MFPFSTARAAAEPKRIAAIVSVYHHNSHADMIVGRLLESDTLDGKGPRRNLKLVSLYADQVPDTDKSRALARHYGFVIAPTVAQALTLGGRGLAVDGILLVAEHGEYPKSATGQTVYPKRRLFEQIVAVFRQSGQAVPVFIDKHLADNWDDALWIEQTARQLGFPLMAGSSLPTTWRYPPDDVRLDHPLAEILVLSYHTLDGYGFHAMEVMQALAEHRQGGETGVARVRCLNGPVVWDRLDQGEVERELLRGALGVLKQRPPEGRRLPDLVKDPTLFQMEYRDGLRTSVLTLNYAVGEWSAAWRYRDLPGIHASLFFTQEFRPMMHFTYQLMGIEQMMLTGKPAWPVERTLLTSGMLDRLLISRSLAGKWLETPELNRGYHTPWNWSQPPPPPPDRPIDAQ